jgi:septal ring factor EnvC (AmiA/AmiB activator)
MQEPLPRVDDDSRAATLGELRSTRRWLAVAAVWAVAATALGVFALIEATKDDDDARAQAAGELGRVQRGLNDRIDELESRIDELPTSDDVSKLDGRIKDIEDASDKATTDTERLGNRLDDHEGRVDDLEGRVDRLEQAQQSQQSTQAAP